MRRIFQSKEKETQRREDPGHAASQPTADDLKGSKTEDSTADIPLRADQEARTGHKLGVKVLYEPSKPTTAVVDIVFVHGLTGTPASTWLHTASGTYWPTTLLSRDIPNSRILSFGYDADVVNFWSPVSQNRIGNHALNLLGGLTRLRERTDTEDRKVIFVAHSLGGLVTQDCLVLSRGHAEKHLQQVSSCTIGIVLMGTPHHGADLAKWAQFGATLAKTVKHVSTNIVSVLKPGSEMLARVQDGFHGLLRQRRDEGSEIAITCFFEELPLHLVGKVVEMESAILPGYASYSIHANHMDMTKFEDKDDSGYESVEGELRRWVKRLQPALGLSRTMKPLFMVPFPKDPKFIGRVEIFKNIEERTRTQGRIALSGIGGVGKSQIAIEFCYRLQEAHADAHVVWIHSSTPQRFNQAYRDIAKKLTLPGWNDPQIDILRSVFEWFNEADRQWLMVLDNADDLDTFFTKPVVGSERTKSLFEYLPQSSQGLILITTRDKRVGERLTGRHTPILVDPMSPLEAQDLLRSQSKRSDSGNDDNDSRALVDALEYIPLAITQAAAFISENDLGLAEYLKMFHTDDFDLQDLLNEDLGDLRRDSESQNSVFRTWKLSYDFISKQKPRAAEMLSFMAVLDRQGIPKSLLQNDTDRNIDVTTALGVLQAFSLIRAGDSGSDYEMHRLVQLATRNWLEMQGTKEEWQEIALLVLADMFPQEDLFENQTTCESLLPHAQIVTQYENAKTACPEQFADLSELMARFDTMQGRYEIAHTRALAAFEVLKDLFGLEHEYTICSMGTLINIYQEQGRWPEAEQLAVQSIEISKRVLGEEHPSTLASISSLGSTYSNQGRWNKAEKLQVQVVKTSKRVLGEEHPGTLSNKHNLAAIYSKQERYKKAEKLQLQVLKTSKRVLGEEHPNTLTVMSSLAGTYWSQKRCNKAIDLMQRAADLRTMISGANHPDTLGAVRTLDEWSHT